MASSGYDGTITETQWAEMNPGYFVETPGSWKVTAKTDALRSVTVAAGTGGGYGVRDEDTPQVVLGPADVVASGSRWDTVVMRRDWQPAGGTSTPTLITGSATKGIAGTRQHNPGVVDDQPIALVRFAQDQPHPQEVIDLRCWKGLGGGLLAADTTALGYLAEPGTAVTIGDTEWIRLIDFSTGTASWQPRRVGALTARASQRAFTGNAYSGQPLHLIAGTQQIVTNVNGDFGLILPGGGFASGILTVQASLSGAVGVGAPAGAYMSLYDYTTTLAGALPARTHFFGRVFVGGSLNPYPNGTFVINYAAWGW